jgi:hypothetical protein
MRILILGNNFSAKSFFYFFKKNKDNIVFSNIVDLENYIEFNSSQDILEFCEANEINLVLITDEEYINQGILEADPFQTLDIKGVGSLVKTAVTLGKQTRPKIKLGICGEHGGDPKTIEFCHSVGLNYVSCSPYRVPIARLAAAQAAIKANE